MNLLDEILKINLFQKALKRERLSINELNSLLSILHKKDIAFELAYTPKSITAFPVFELTLIFSPNLELTFKITVCD